MKYLLKKQYSENKLDSKNNYERSTSFNLKRVINGINIKKLLLNDRDNYNYLINKTSKLDENLFSCDYNLDSLFDLNLINLHYFGLKIKDINKKEKRVLIERDRTSFLKSIFEDKNTLRVMDNIFCVFFNTIENKNLSPFVFLKYLLEYDKRYIKVIMIETLNLFMITFL